MEIHTYKLSIVLPAAYALGQAINRIYEMYDQNIMQKVLIF